MDKMGSKNRPFLVKSGDRTSSKREVRMDKQKTIDALTSWFIAARDSGNDSDKSLRLSAEAAYNEITRHEKPSDDLSGIKSALGLPEDTPEPLVGLVWRLQQRIEDLEEMVRGPFPHPELSEVDKPEKKARYVARVRIERSSGDILIGKGGCLFTTPLNKPPPTHSSVEAAIAAMKNADDRLPRGATRLIENAGTGETVRTFSPDAWLQELVL